MTIRPAILHHYRRFRAHQLETYWPTIIGLPSGVVIKEYTGGGAAYGLHAYAAYTSARSHLHFMATLKATIADHKKRSAAAKRGWKKRRAA